MDEMMKASVYSDTEWFDYIGFCGSCGDEPERCSCAGTCGCWELHAHLTLGPWLAQVPGQLEIA